MGRVIPTRETVITEPVRDPLTIEFVRMHLKSISHCEDELIQSWIASAGLYFREMTGRDLINTTREYWLDGSPTQGVVIELPRPPLQSVVSVQYEVNGSLVTFTDGGSPDLPLYDVMAPAGPYARPGQVILKANGSWPTVSVGRPGAVRIRFISGYGATPAQIPELVKTTLCAIIGSFDQFRSETYASDRSSQAIRLPFGIDLLMDGFKSSALRTTVPTWE